MTLPTSICLTRVAELNFGFVDLRLIRLDGGL
jgi:hypothetical protein